MKNKILYIYLLLIFGSLAGMAQTVSPVVQPADGGYSAHGNLQLQYTIGEPVNQTYKSGSYQFTLGFGQPQPDIVVNAIAAGPYCAGTSISIPFSPKDLPGSHTFAAQLSDSSGSFASPITIGVDTITAHDTITVTIPTGLTGGTNYRIRILTSGTVVWVSVPFSILLPPASFTPVAQNSALCPGASTNVLVTGSQTGVNYLLICNGLVVSSSLGTGDTLLLNTGALGAGTVFNITATDTTTNCTYNSPGVTVSVAQPYFASGDTVLCVGDTGCYVAIAPDSAQIVYSIFYGNAVIDSVTGCVSQVNGNFTVAATAVDSGCSVMNAFINVKVPVIGLPDIPPFQLACSDTPVLFNLASGFMGSNANKIMWAADSIFTSPQSSALLSTAQFSVYPGADTTIWVMNADSISGCVSGVVSSGAAVYALPDSFIAYATDTIVCPGNATSININGTQSSVLYTLRADTGIIATALGNGGTITFSTGAVNATSWFMVTAADTLTGCSPQSGALITIQIAPLAVAPVFSAPDTLICTSSPACYTASSASSNSVIYTIISGPAVIDSITGCVSSVTGNFTIVATAADTNGCSVATDTLHVSTTNILPPAPPPSQTVQSDTPFTFTFIITAGCGGNQVQWSLDSSFSTSYLGSSPDTISFSVDTNASATLWIRSKDSVTGNVSNKVATKAGNEKLTAHWEIWKVGVNQTVGNQDQQCSTSYLWPNCVLPSGNWISCPGTIEPYYTCEIGYVQPGDGYYAQNQCYPGSSPFQGLCNAGLTDCNGNTLSQCDQKVTNYHLYFYLTNGTCNGTSGPPIVVTYPGDYSGMYSGDPNNIIPSFYFQSYDPHNTIVPYANFPTSGTYILSQITYDWIVNPNGNFPNDNCFGNDEILDVGTSGGFCPLYLVVNQVPQLDFKITNPNCNNQYCFTVTYANGTAIDPTSVLGSTFLGNAGGFSVPYFSFPPSLDDILDLCLPCTATVCQDFSPQAAPYTVTLNESGYVVPTADIECSVTHQFKVTDPPVISVNSITGCTTGPSQQLTAIQTTNPGTIGTYHWSTSPGVPAGISNGYGPEDMYANVFPGLVANGTYTVTFTTEQDCNVTTSYTVDLNICCQAPITAFTLNNESVSHYFENQSQTNPLILFNTSTGVYSFNIAYCADEVAINGAFTVDKPLYISHYSNIKMGQNAVINVSPGSALSLYKSNISACDYMWQGINISGTGFVFNGVAYEGGASFAANGCAIADAVTAVNSTNGSYYNIQGSNFVDNLVGIEVQPFNGNFAGAVFDSRFYGSAATLKPPYNNEAASNGIEVLNNYNVTIGQNTFYNIRNGIFTYASNTTINQCIFENIITPGAGIGVPGALSDGAGIYALGNIFTKGPATYNINVTGYNTDPTANTTVNFNNMQYGIVLNQMNATINGNYFNNIGSGSPSSLGYAVYIENGNNKFVNVENNLMTAIRAGVYSPSNPNLFLVANNNYIHASHANGVLGSTLIPDGSGIFVSQAANTISNNTYISNNHLFDFIYGVNLLNVGGTLEVSDNTFDMTGGTPKAEIGINAVNCQYAQIIENTFNGTAVSTTVHNTSNLLRTGIFMNNCPKSLLQCNVMDYTSYGMHFQGNNVPVNDAKIVGNIFHHHYTGMYFDHPSAGVDARIGQLGDATYSDADIFTPLVYTNYVSNYQTISTNTGSSPGLLYYYSLDGGNVNFGSFFIYQLASHQILGDINEYNCGFFSGHVPTRFGMLKYAADVIDDSAFINVDTAFLPTAQYEAQKFVYSLVDSFADLQDSSSIEFFYKTTEETSVGSMDLLYGYVNQLSDSSTFSDSSAFATALASVADYNNNIYTSANYDYNEKMVMSAYLTTVAAGLSLTADSPSLAFVTWLAHQCPYTEGNAVYQARGLFAEINPDELYNDDSLCPLPHGETRMLIMAADTTSGDSASSFNIRLHPNPAKDYTTIYYNIDLSQQATLQVYDQLGQLVIKQSLPGITNSAIIQTHQLTDGVYNYQFILNHQVIKRGKFVVVH